MPVGEQEWRLNQFNKEKKNSDFIIEQSIEFGNYIILDKQVKMECIQSLGIEVHMKHKQENVKRNRNDSI
ncbi:unnamed protein product [Paramecium sonneborni]|uniref:Uncharacterized protein n=1 Tax=Paramecium sonneborni TaxID=65129 RepID=A0A8S1RK74_9CILI|nr:unnamed protein product [Paramecium sonneborni]